jgi:hypothetical protein
MKANWGSTYKASSHYSLNKIIVSFIELAGGMDVI